MKKVTHVFRTEEELVQKLVQHNKNNFAVREVGVGYGVSDLLIVRNKTEMLRFIQGRKGVHLRHLDEIRVFDYIRKRKRVYFEDIVENFYIPRSRLKYKILKYLEQVGSIMREGDVYSRISEFGLFCPNVTAIEAKLTDWSKGLAQAIRYQRFADKTYLALDEQYIHRAVHDEFKQHNVGLLSVGPKGVKEVVRPALKKPLDPLMTFKVAEEIISKLSTCEKHLET